MGKETEYMNTELIKTIEINGEEVTAHIKILVEDDHDYDTTDWDYTEAGRRIKSGELFVAVIHVTAVATDLEIEGSYAIGGCILRPNNMFNSEPFETDVKTTLDDNNMIDIALYDLKKNIIGLANKLKKFA